MPDGSDLPVRSIIAVEDGAIVSRGEEQSPVFVYLATLRTESGRYTMKRKLDKLAQMLRTGKSAGATWDTFPWEQLTYGHVQAIMSKLLETYKPSYVNTILSAIKGVMLAAWRGGLIDVEHYQRIKSVRSARGGSDEPTGRYVSNGERNALMSICLADSTPAGARDAAIIALGYPGGLRRTEIVSLDRGDVEDDGETVTVKVSGKGRKERIVPLDNGGAEAIRDWLKVRGPEEGPLFYSGRKGGHLVKRQRMTAQAAYAMLKRRAKQAGVKDLGTHDLRRSTASDLLDITDALTVADYLGHASTNTTRKYDKRGERAKRKAAQGLHIAYTPRRIWAMRNRRRLV